ncbi:MAG: diacylglycerol kinase [Kiritimatiellae bacterium]|nr:diacylglycerol kinase [Kiritimatiellia bacterium]
MARIDKEDLKARIADLVEKANELKSEIRTLSELKTPQELKDSAEYSARGFRAVLFGEKAFRTDVVIFVFCTIAALLLPVSWCERAVMIYTVFMALVAEIINTAIETVVDRISLERNELSGRAKDIASCLVVAAFVGAGVAWTIILAGLAIRLI